MPPTLALLGPLITAGCAKALLEVAPAPVPASLLTRRDAPAKPAGDYTQKAVVRYIVDLHEAHADCQSKFSAIREAL